MKAHHRTAHLVPCGQHFCCKLFGIAMLPQLHLWPRRREAFACKKPLVIKLACCQTCADCRSEIKLKSRRAHLNLVCHGVRIGQNAPFWQRSDDKTAGSAFGLTVHLPRSRVVWTVLQAQRISRMLWCYRGIRWIISTCRHECKTACKTAAAAFVCTSGNAPLLQLHKNSCFICNYAPHNHHNAERRSHASAPFLITICTPFSLLMHYEADSQSLPPWYEAC